MRDAQVHMAAVDWTRTSRLVVPYTLTPMLCAWPWAFWVQCLRREWAPGPPAGLRGLPLLASLPPKQIHRSLLLVGEDCMAVIPSNFDTFTTGILSSPVWGTCCRRSHEQQSLVRAAPLPVRPALRPPASPRFGDSPTHVNTTQHARWRARVHVPGIVIHADSQHNVWQLPILTSCAMRASVAG